MQAADESNKAMRWSMAVGVLMLAGKWVAFWLTGSAAIFSDAAESVIHVIAVFFAGFSLYLSTLPPGRRFPYGLERITFFSAGFEGALIILAAVAIIGSAIWRWRSGLELTNLGSGTLIVCGASLANLALGWYLVRTGRRNNSLILEANGKHVLTDSWTSFGVVAGLLLVLLTGWKPFDPLIAIAVALNIIWSGGDLMYRAIRGLLDYADPETGQLIRDAMDKVAGELSIQYHGIRFHSTGSRLRIDVHLLFPQEIAIGEAHRIATLLEDRFPAVLGTPAELVTHLEAEEDHSDVHTGQHYTGKPS